MIFGIILTLVLMILNGLFYRFGGMGKEEKSWVPLFLRESWIRDWILPFFSLVILFIWWKPDIWWGYLLSIPVYGLMGGALSTYWDFINGWLGLSDDKIWFNWLLHGFFIGISFFPFIFVGLVWYSVLINGIISGLLMMWISVKNKNVWIEECGRGIVSAFARLFLLIK